MLPFIADLPPQLQERVVCSIAAAAKYEVPANIVLAIAEKEGGKPGQWVLNSNGTHDVGPMQFNTAYLTELSRYGITTNDVAAAGCYPFDLAAWRIRGHLRNDKGDLWTRASNYHSRTPKYNEIYRADLMRKALKWADWLESHFVTLDFIRDTGQTSSVQQQTARQPAQSPKAVAVNTDPKALTGYVPRQIFLK